MAKPKKTVTKSEDNETAADKTVSDKSEATTPMPEDKPSATQTGDKAPSTFETDKPDAKTVDAAEKDNTAKSAVKTSAEVETSAATDKSDTAPALDEAKPKASDASTKPSPVTPEKAKADTSPPATAKPPKTTTDKDSSKPWDKGASKATSASPTSSTSTAKSDSAKTDTAKPSEKTPAEKPVQNTKAPEPVVKERKRSVFFPMVLGGLIAGGLGYAASEYDVLGNRAQNEAALQEALDAQQARIAELETRVDAPAPEPETPPEVAALTEELTTARQELATLQEQLAGIDSRLTTVEKQPASGGDNEIAVAAFEREMEALRNSVAEQRSEIEALLENAQSVEEATAEAAEAARAQTAMSRINTALAAGRPFDAVLAELQAAGVEDIPEALSAASGGVVTLANLQSRYPDAARAALATARAEVPEGGESGFGSFLKRQLGARSVAPREGTDPDAVLSRAEAAVRDGRLTDALAEIETLSNAAQDAMADWLADARARQAAENAADDLSQRLTAN
ncbi:mitofilin family membrane protein [Sulfitobacter maritimus]|uniref:mitofilin family membrane protein n=1 Tax=Sulfitobacter maritimus TaxID=2741719 RepID=UPI0031B5FFD2